MTYQVRYLAVNSETTWSLRGARLIETTEFANTPAVIVLDIADETHAVDTIPLVRGRSDAALLASRRLAREFPGVALATLLPLRKRRRDAVADVVLVAADTAAKHTAQLTALAQQHSLRGVYTPALLVAEWMRRAKQSQRQVLVVLPTPAGLRLVYIDQGRPLLSRLMPMTDDAAIAVEIGRTVQYLHNTQRVTRESPVDILFWGMTLAQVSACRPPGDAHRVVTTPIVSRLADPTRDGFRALLHMAATRPSREQLAPLQMRAGWLALLVRRWGQALAAAALVSGCVLAWWISQATGELRTATASLRDQAAADAAARASVAAILERQGMSLQDVRDMPEAGASLDNSLVPLREAFVVAGRVLGAQRDIALGSLEFHAVPLVGAPPADRTCGNDRLAPVASLEAKFTVTPGLGVRARAQAIAAVRDGLLKAAPWRSTAESTALDQRTSLVAKAGADSSIENTEWTTCLLRGAGA